MALERVVHHPSIKANLLALSIRSPQQQTRLWMEQKRLFVRATTLIKAIGKPCLTSTQAKKLDSLGFNFQSLTLLSRQYSTGEEFQTALKERGVRSKPLREKLSKALHNSR